MSNLLFDFYTVACFGVTVSLLIHFIFSGNASLQPTKALLDLRTSFVLLIFLTLLPFEQAAKVVMPKSIPTISSVSFSFSNSCSIPTDKYQYFPSNETLGLQY